MKKFGITIIVIFAVIIVGIGLISLFTPDSSMSEIENRSLRTKVNVSGEFIMKGETQDDIEDYFKDQVAFRDFWMGFRTNILKLFGKKEIGGVYLGKDGYYFEKILEEDIIDSTVDKNIAYIDDFIDFYENGSNANVSVMIVPTSGYMLSDKMPANAPMFDQRAYLDRFEEAFGEHYVDVSDTASDGVGVGPNYYMTDHHWTSQGAYNAANIYLDSVGLDAVPEGEFKPVTEDFKGTLFSKVLDSSSKEDVIDRYYFDEEPKYTLEINGESAEDIYVADKLKYKDQYKYFFGDNYGRVDIVAPLNRTGRKLLIIKDSFANAFAPLLSKSFDEVTMVDLRYYDGDMATLCTQGGYSDVLILYNIANFIKEKNLVFIKGLDGKFTNSGTSSNVSQNDDGTFEITGSLGDDDVASGADNTVDNASYNDPEPVPNENGGLSSGSISWDGNLIIIGNRAYEVYGYYDKGAEKYIDIVSSLADKLQGQTNVYCLLIPLGDEVALSPEHRAELRMGDQRADIISVFDRMSSSVKTVNIYDTMAKYSSEYIYFKTDHHWTQRGAYYAYREYCKKRGVPVKDLSEYETRKFDNYLGSFYAETQNSALANNPDYVEVFYPKGTNQISITQMDGSPLNWYVINDVSNYKTTAKYSCFIGGDNPYSVIHNPEKTDGSACMIIKESFGNAFTPFLVDDYEYVYVVDYRYYSDGTIYDLAIEKGVDDILFCNNLGALSDSYKLGVLKSISGAN